MAMSFKPAEAAQAGAIRDLVRSAYALYVARMDREPAPMLADYAGLVASGAVTVAETDGELAGILVCYPDGEALHVENIAVAPVFQGQGIGHRLMDHAESHALKARLRWVELYTNAIMTENIAFYERRGYVIRERGEQDGYDRIFFVKELG